MVIGELPFDPWEFVNSHQAHLQRNMCLQYLTSYVELKTTAVHGHSRESLGLSLFSSVGSLIELCIHSCIDLINVNFSPSNISIFVLVTEEMIVMLTSVSD